MDRVASLKNMLASSPSDCFLLHALGLEYIKLHELQEGLNYFNRVIEADVNYVGTYYHLAKTYEKLNQLDRAIDTYEKGIQIAMKLKDKHAQNELQMALDDLLY